LESKHLQFYGIIILAATAIIFFFLLHIPLVQATTSERDIYNSYLNGIKQIENNAEIHGFWEANYWNYRRIFRNHDNDAVELLAYILKIVPIEKGKIIVQDILKDSKLSLTEKHDLLSLTILWGFDRHPWGLRRIPKKQRPKWLFTEVLMLEKLFLQKNIPCDFKIFEYCLYEGYFYDGWFGQGASINLLREMLHALSNNLLKFRSKSCIILNKLSDDLQLFLLELPELKPILDNNLKVIESSTADLWSLLKHGKIQQCLAVLKHNPESVSFSLPSCNG